MGVGDPSDTSFMGKEGGGELLSIRYHPTLYKDKMNYYPSDTSLL